jgi:NADH-quinone oxidoreductase subunit K
MTEFSFLFCVSVILFTIGSAAVIARKNILVVFMGLELLLNASVLSFVNFSAQMGDASGQVFALFIFVIAAVEVAVGIGVLILLYRLKGSLTLSDYNHLSG